MFLFVHKKKIIQILNQIKITRSTNTKLKLKSKSKNQKIKKIKKSKKIKKKKIKKNQKSKIKNHLITTKNSTFNKSISMLFFQKKKSNQKNQKN